MPQPEKVKSSIDQGVDRKNLNTIRDRFLQVNAARLARTKSALTGRQQIILELLPLLFHVNHPILPGYVTQSTPSGVAHYNPSKVDLQKAQRLARSFNYHRQPNPHPQITGLFLMGSCGTVAQSKKSDLDIWVCHLDNMKSSDVLLLRQKCDSISQWAMTKGLEVHFFLMEGERFRLGERESLSSEDCGSAQHYLLLDEFYRTGLLIAGRIPIWWLIPPEEDKNHDYYAKILRDKKFVREGNTIDFGGVGSIPAGEFIGAGVWQLYKAIDSPYKSVLKILLTEVYAAEYPNVEPLSTAFKRAIYNNQLDINELDPYVVVYRKLELYLLDRNEFKRLELVRRCFYFKVGKALSRRSRSGNKPWQHQLMEKLAVEWEWSKEHLHNLDTRKKWKVGRVISEQKELVRELTNSYRFVLGFARRTRSTAMINSREMTILGRKLYAAFERKADKIEWINPGIAPNLVEENLTFFISDESNQDQPQWAVSDEPAKSNEYGRVLVLKKADDLTTLLAWCHFNGLCDNSTRIAIIEGTHSVKEYELHNMMRTLRQKLPVAKQYSEQDDEKNDCFNRAMRPNFVQLFINVGIDPLASKRNQGIELISARTDSLGYSGLRENLILNVEQVVVNSWGELSSRRYDGNNALLRCLLDYLQMLPPKSRGALPLLSIQCFCPTRATAISMRVEELFRDVASCFYSGTRPINSRYVIEIQREYFVIQFGDSKAKIEHALNFRELLIHLSSPQSEYSPIVLDQYCQPGSTLQVISRYAQADTVQVFYQQKGDLAEIYILDEMSSLYTFKTTFYNVRNLLAPLDQFIQSTLFRQSSEAGEFNNEISPDFDLQNRETEYYEIVERRNRKEVSRRILSEEIDSSGFFNVQAIGSRNDNGKIHFDIYCDQQEFIAAEFGEDIFSVVAAYILSRRKTSANYPCYITDLDLSRCVDDSAGAPIQTIQYLQFKQKLELQLNAALRGI